MSRRFGFFDDFALLVRVIDLSELLSGCSDLGSNVIEMVCLCESMCPSPRKVVDPSDRVLLAKSVYNRNI